MLPQCLSIRNAAALFSNIQEDILYCLVIKAFIKVKYDFFFLVMQRNAIPDTIFTLVLYAEASGLIFVVPQSWLIAKSTSSSEDDMKWSYITSEDKRLTIISHKKTDTLNFTQE